MEDSLAHTRRIEALIAEGRKAEAARLHNEHLAAEMERAKSEPICLTDLMAAKEAFIVNEGGA